MPPPTNPLELLTDVELVNTQITLAVGCGRSRSALRRHNRERVCVLLALLKLEGDRRGIPNASPPYKA